MSKINIILIRPLLCRFVCPAGGKKLQLFLMGSFHKSPVNGWWLLRSSCTRLKIARFLPDSVLKLNMQFSTKSQSTIPSTCISQTAAWLQHYNEGSDWLLCKLNIHACHCLTHTPKQQPDPDRIIQTHFIFPMSWTFAISVLWPEAEHSLPGVVTTASRPDGKQSRDGTANSHYDRQQRST